MDDLGHENRSPEKERAGESLEQELAQECPERPATEKAVGLEDDGISDVEEQFVSEGSVEEDEIRVSGESVPTIRDEASGATVHDDPPTDDD